jgi:hypothetical protein
MLYIKQLHPEIFHYSMLIIIALSYALPRLELRMPPVYFCLVLSLFGQSCPVLFFPVQFSSVISYSVVSCRKFLFAILSSPVLPCHNLSGPIPSHVPIIFSCMFCSVLLVTVFHFLPHTVF